MDALIIPFQDTERARQIRALLKERRDWAKRFESCWAEPWDVRARRIIEAEMKRIERELRELGWRK